MKKIYTAPSLTLVSIRVEHGYAQSVKLSMDQSIQSVFHEKSSSINEGRSIVSKNWRLSDEGSTTYDESFWGSDGF